MTPFFDMPNPFVLVANHQYYLYSTATTTLLSPPIQLRISKDLKTWSSLVNAMPTLPEWAWYGSTWAPDVRWIGGRYVMYFTAGVRNYSPDTKCIGAATSTNPAGPFVPLKTAMVCQLDHRGSIDPRTFVDRDGTVWLHWKSDDNADVGGTSHTTIYGQRLSSDGLNVVGTPATLFTADQPWEGRIVEAPQMVLANGQYWVFYSGNWFNEPYYAIGVAKCLGPAGPCTKPYLRPFLASNAQGQGPGESSLFEDRGAMYLVYGPWAVNFRTDTLRPVALARVAFGGLGPYLAVPTLPTYSELTTAATAATR